MTIICVYVTNCSREEIHERLDYISRCIPCFASYHSNTQEGVVKCRREDAAFVVTQLAEYV